MIIFPNKNSGAKHAEFFGGLHHLTLAVVSCDSLKVTVFTMNKIYDVVCEEVSEL